MHLSMSVQIFMIKVEKWMIFSCNQYGLFRYLHHKDLKCIL